MFRKVEFGVVFFGMFRRAPRRNFFSQGVSTHRPWATEPPPQQIPPRQAHAQKPEQVQAAGFNSFIKIGKPEIGAQQNPDANHKPKRSQPDPHDIDVHVAFLIRVILLNFSKFRLVLTHLAASG